MLLVPINITGIRGKLSVLEGHNLQLTCEVSGRPDPSINWTKENPGNQGNTVVVQGKVLNITNINRTDAGNYTCTAYNDFGKPDNQTVYVNVTCEYALKKCLNNVKQRCTFLLFSDKHKVGAQTVVLLFQHHNLKLLTKQRQLVIRF